MTSQIHFDDGGAYERYMGVWSRLVGASFLDWLAPSGGLRWLDVGCGNGAFTVMVAERCAPAMIHGIDPSEAQLAFARTRLPASLARFERGDAMALPFAPDSFDVAVMPLVIFFVPDPQAGVAEMARVVRPGGVVASYSWDMAGGGFPYAAVQSELRAMAVEVPSPPSPDASRAERLIELWTGAGLESIETREITVERTYADFDDYWQTIVGGPSVGRQLRALSAGDRAQFTTRLRERLPAADAQGRITTAARANAIRGRVRVQDARAWAPVHVPMRRSTSNFIREGDQMKRMLVALALLSPAAAHAQWRMTQHFPVGGDGRWDYVVPDPSHHRVFIGRENRVMVVDETDGHLLGEVKGIHGAHGTAVDATTGHGFATSGDDSSIVMFDLGTFAVLGRAHAAEDADAIIFDEPSRRVLSFNGDAHSATVLEPVRGTLVTNIDLGGKPEYGVSAGDGMVYVNLTDTSEVVEIDAKALRVTRRWSTAPCRQPVAMAIDRVHRRLFSGCRSGVMAVSDIAAGKVIATLPIGAGTDGAAFDPAAGDAFASNADGTLTVIHEDAPDAYHVSQTVTTAPGSRNMGLDTLTHRAFIVGAKFGPAPAQATPDNPRRRPAMLPGTFEVMVIERK